MFNRKQRKARQFSIFAVLMMAVVVFSIPMSSDGSSEAPETTYWTYKITIGGNNDASPVYIESVTDGNGNPTENLTNTNLGSWRWDENFEYGPFGSYYAAFNSDGNIVCHLRADDLNTKVGYPVGTRNVPNTYDVMWVLPTIYWSADKDGNLILSNDPSKGTAYAHTIDGKVYNYMALGVYKASVENNALRSLSDIVINFPRVEFVQTYKDVIDVDGDGVSDGIRKAWNYYQYALYKYCVFTTLGTMDSQSFAWGPVKVSSPFPTGYGNLSTLVLPGYYAQSTYLNFVSPFRLFIENPWEFTSTMMADIYSYNGGLYIGDTTDLKDTPENGMKILDLNNLGGYSRNIATSAYNWGLPLDSKGSWLYGTRDYFGGYSSKTSIGYVSLYTYSINEPQSGGISAIYTNYGPGAYGASYGTRTSFVFDNDPVSFLNVTFDQNNGEPLTVVDHIYYGTQIELPTPTWEFHDFDGWYYGDTFIGMGGDRIRVMLPTKLVAHWVPHSADLLLLYNISGSIDDQIYRIVTFNKGTAPLSLMPDDPKQDGLFFLGWYNEPRCENAFDPSKIMTADGKAYAKWTPAPEIISPPTIVRIPQDTYTMSIPLKDDQTAVWYDYSGNVIGTGSQIEHLFTESDLRTGYVRVYGADNVAYTDVDWSIENKTDDGGINYAYVAIAGVLAIIGIFILRRFI